MGVEFQQMKWPWNSNISLDEMETNGIVQLNSLFCKEKRSKKQNPATTVHFYHPMVNKCSEEMYLTIIYKIFHDSRPKKVLFINQSSGTFLPFPARPWISSSVTSQSSPSHCEKWPEDETATDSKVKTNAPFSPTKHVY